MWSKITRTDGRTDGRTNGDIEALADAMRALKNPHESRFLEAPFVRQADDELKKPNSEGGILKWLF